MKLSIGVAVYNVKESFLRECIEGIIAQLTDETELLLIDDCSTDNSGAVCREYAENNSRVRYINMGENGGLSRVRNRTIAESAGKWICFADGDDLLSDNYVETALRFCDAEYDLITYDKTNFSAEKGAEEKCAVTELKELQKGAGRELSLSCLCIKPFDFAKYGMNETAAYHGAWGALYSKEFLVRKNLLFPDGQKKAQDGVFNTTAYFLADKIAYLPYVMYYYRKNEEGITQRYSKDFTGIIKSLINWDYKNINELYGGDAEVEALYKKYKVTALVLDSMRLNFFHKDNKKPKKVRKAEFSEFVETEPFKDAIWSFDLKNCDWWGWRLPIYYAKKKYFCLLELVFRHENIFKIYGALDTRVQRLKNRICK